MKIHIPLAEGVPGMHSQPPSWPKVDLLSGFLAWPDSKSLSIPKGLDDPRWSGHLSIGYPGIGPTLTNCCGNTPTPVDSGFGTATNEDVAFRALHHLVGADRFLYLSWWVKADVLDNPLDDRLTLGLTRATGDAMVMEITPVFDLNAANPGPLGTITLGTVGTANGEVQPWTENGGNVPSWIRQNTHVWTDSVSGRWAVQMRMPLGSAGVDTQVNLANDFRIWFEVAVELPNNLVAPYSWPRNVCVASRCGLPRKWDVPLVSAWSEATLGSPATGDTGFVRLRAEDISAHHQHPPGTPPTPHDNSAATISLTQENVFEAAPENRTGATINPGDLNAEFRIADWGSAGRQTASWKLVPASFGTSNPAPPTAPVPHLTHASMTMKWKLSTTEAAEFSPPVNKPRHQCVLVTLTGSPVLNPAAAWQNMEFVDASRFERPATIDNRGLGRSPAPGAPRPAYLLVERLSMPPVPPRGRGPGKPEPEPGPDPKPDGGEPGPINVAREGDGGLAALTAALAEQGEVIDRREQEPTIRYHVYHDTGIDVTDANGRDRRVVVPGTAFGFHVTHEGPLKGWRDEIQGATRITDRFYRLDVPDEGTATITTVIEAVEPPGCLVFLQWLWGLVKKLFGGP